MQFEAGRRPHSGQSTKSSKANSQYRDQVVAVVKEYAANYDKMTARSRTRLRIS